MRAVILTLAIGFLLGACAESPQLALHTLRPAVPWPDAKPAHETPAVAEAPSSIDATPITAYSPATDAQIQATLVARSLATFSGGCPCPYSIDRNGQRCGERSVYARLARSDLLCHPHDVTPRMIADYRARR